MSDSPPPQGSDGTAGYTHLAQLAMISAADLQKLHGMGPKAVGILRDALAARGLTFAGELPAQQQ